MSEQAEATDGRGEWKDGKFVFPLNKPIKAHGEEVSSIEIREPSGGDMIAVGNPVHFDPMSDPPRLLPDAAKMAQMIARLAAIPPSSVAQISPKELTQIAWILVPFFSPV